jgi:hypothetical protein
MVTLQGTRQTLPMQGPFDKLSARLKEKRLLQALVMASLSNYYLSIPNETLAYDLRSLCWL